MDYGPGREGSKSAFRLAARGVYRSLQSIFPTAYYVLRYKIAERQARGAFEANNRPQWRKTFFDLASEPRRQCLQIGVFEAEGGKFGPNWVSVDKYDHRSFIDFQDDITALHFADDTFDALYCNAILEHVPEPLLAIAEFLRVLKPGGIAWIEVPMTYPYHEAPKDFWRVTPEGMRLWMRNFDEVACGINYLSRSSLACSTYFLGRKPSTGK